MYKNVAEDNLMFKYRKQSRYDEGSTMRYTGDCCTIVEKTDMTL